MDAECELVESRALLALRLATVVLTAAVLQPLEHLPLACGRRQRGTAGGDLGVAAVELESARLAHALRPLEVGLCGQDVVAAGNAARERLHARLSRAVELVGGGTQHRLAVQTMRHGRGEVFLGLVLDAYAHRAHPLEAECEGT